jgi:hypothetical protein
MCVCVCVCVYVRLCVCVCVCSVFLCTSGPHDHGHEVCDNYVLLEHIVSSVQDESRERLR